MAGSFAAFALMLSGCAHAACAAVELDRGRKDAEYQCVPEPVLRINAERRHSVFYGNAGKYKRHCTQSPQRFPKQAFEMFSIHIKKLYVL